MSQDDAGYEKAKILNIHLAKMFMRSTVTLDGVRLPVSEIVIRQTFDANEITLTLDPVCLDKLEAYGEFLAGEATVNVMIRPRGEQIE